MKEAEKQALLMAAEYRTHRKGSLRRKEDSLSSEEGRGYRPIPHLSIPAVGGFGR